jgi:hypothetical protein
MLLFRIVDKVRAVIQCQERDIYIPGLGVDDILTIKYKA